VARRRTGRGVVGHQFRGRRRDISGDPHNEKVHEVTDEVVGVPDRRMESHFEYGTTAACPQRGEDLRIVHEILGKMPDVGMN